MTQKTYRLIIFMFILWSPVQLLAKIQVESYQEVSFEELHNAIVDSSRLLNSFGKDKGTLYIGGATVEAILSHLRDGTPIKIRDLDLYLLTSEKYEASVWEKVNIEKHGIQKFRVLPNMVQLSMRDLPIDITYVPDPEKLKSFGIFNVDIMKIEVATFLEAMSKDRSDILSSISVWLFEGQEYENLIKRHIFLNPYKSISDLDWETLVFRSSRTFSKLGFNYIPNDVLNVIEEFWNSRLAQPINKKNWLKGILKVLGDQTAGQQLQMLEKINALDIFSIDLRKKIQSLPPEEIDKILGSAISSGGNVNALAELVYSFGGPKDIAVLKDLSIFLDKKYHRLIFRKGELKNLDGNCFKAVEPLLL